MNRVFADTSYFVALLTPTDQFHPRALSWTLPSSGQLITSAWVLNELANFLARPVDRPHFLAILNSLRSDASVLVAEPDAELFEKGLRLFAARTDKSWSLTDCISFVIMTDEAIADALTADHHFEQAGFNVLLK